MKKLLLLFMCLWCGRYAGHTQSLHVDSTRFITGLSPATVINYAMPTSDKGILFTGYVAGNPGGIIPACPYGGENVLIGKIDSNRQISWIKVYGGNDDDAASKACQTPDGGYAIIGGTTSHDGDVTGFKGGVDIWLIRTDAAGNKLWAKTYGSTQSDGGVSIANTPDRGFIILGNTNGSNGDVPVHYGDFFSEDWVVIKVDSNGTVQWSEDLGGSGDEGMTGSILSIGNNYYLVSSSNSSDHDCTDTVWHTSPLAGYSDVYVLKLDNAGNVLWDSSYGGSHTDGGNYAILDERDSSIVVVGFSLSNDGMVTGHMGSTSTSDIWVLKLNKNGTLLWQKTLGNTKDDVGTGICNGTVGGYVVYGSIMPGPLGGEDCWMYLLDNAGSVMYSSNFGGNDAELPTSILPFQKGYVAVGTSLSTSFSQGITTGRYCDGENGFVTYVDYWPLGLQDINDERQQMSVYPNPTATTLIINTAAANGTLEIADMMGRTVYTATVLQRKNIVDVAGLADGLYGVKWVGENGSVETGRFIKR